MSEEKQPIGTPLAPFEKLKKDLSAALEKKENISRDVKKIIRNYWNDEANTAARNQETTWGDNVAYIVDFGASFDEFLPLAVESAGKDIEAWEALRQSLIARLKSVGELSGTARAALLWMLENERPKRRGGQPQTPADYHRNMQLARVVYAVREALKGGNKEMSVFSLVALETGETEDVVKTAYKSMVKKTRCGGSSAA